LNLVPVRDLNDTVKESIIAIEPGLAPSIDNLFLCSDHFRKRGSQRGGFDSRHFSSLVPKNINKRLASGEVGLRFAAIKHFKNRAHLKKLLMLLRRGVSVDTTLNPRVFNREEIVQTVTSRLREMNNNYSRGSAYGNYNPNHPSHSAHQGHPASAHPAAYSHYEASYPESQDPAAAVQNIPGYQQE